MHVSPDGAIDIDIIKYGDYDDDEEDLDLEAEDEKDWWSVFDVYYTIYRKINSYLS